MKSLRLLVVLLALLYLTEGSSKAVAQPVARITLQVFYDELSPYGNWIYDRDYGCEGCLLTERPARKTLPIIDSLKSVL